MTVNKKIKKKKVKSGHVDWARVKAWFMQDHSRTLMDVADEFKLHPSTVKNHSRAEKWFDERKTQATHVYTRATEKIIDEQVDLAARCNNDTIEVARAIREKVRQFLESNELSPHELNAVAQAHDKAVSQERLGLGLSTSSTEVTGKDGSALVQSHGVLVVPAPLSPEAWEKSVSEYQSNLYKK